MIEGSPGNEPQAAAGRGVMASMALMSMALWGSAYFVIVVTLRDIPPVLMGFLRISLSFIFLMIIMRIINPRFLWKDYLRDMTTGGIRGKRAWVLAAALALFGTTLPNVLQNVGMIMMDESSTSSLAALIQGSGPIYTIILAVFIFKEKIGPWKIIGLAVVIPCTLVLTTYGSAGFSFDSKETLGAFLNLLTALCYSASAIFLKFALNRGGSPLRVLKANTFYATLLMIPILVGAYAFGLEDPFNPIDSSLTAWLGLIYLSIGVIITAGILWYRVYRKEEVSRVIFFVFLLPLFSTLVGYLFLGERLAPVQLIAGAALLIGVGVSQVGAWKKTSGRTI
ncbi:MAG: DMT family transporter [Thermoplasmatota archaeon]